MKDPIVQGILVSKANVDNLQAEYKKIVEKDPSKANEVNLNYALYKGGYNDYMQGRVKKVGSMSYTPNIEYRKELKDIAENIEKFDTEIEKTWVDGQGYIYTQKGKRITEDRIRNIAESFLTDGAKKQMVIDGWGSIHQGNTEEERMANTVKAFEQYKVNKLSSEKELLATYRGQANKTGSEVDKENLRLANENYNNIEKGLNNIGQSGSAEQMYGTIYKSSTLDNFSKTFAYNTVDITDIKSDTTYMSKVRMSFDAEQDRIKNAMAEKKYQLDVKKAGMKTDANGNLVSEISPFITKSGMDNEVEKAGNVQKEAFQEISGLNEVIKAQEDSVFNSLSTEVQADIDREVKNSKGLKSRADVLVEYHQGGLVTGEEADTLNSLINDRYAKQEVYNRYAKEVDAIAEKKLDSPDLYKELYDNPNIKIMWKGNDGKERLYPAKDVLVNSGLVNKNGEKIKSSKQVTDAIKKSMLADKFLSDSGNAQLITKNTNLINLARLNNENINDVVISSQDKRHSGRGYQSNEINPNTITGQYILKHSKGKGFDSSIKTDSFDDINTANAYFKEVDAEERNRKIGERLMKDKTVTFGKIVMVQPGTLEYTQIATQAGFNIKDTKPIEIRKIPNQPDMVAITVGEGSSKKIEPSDVPNEQKLRISELNPNVLSQINLYNTKAKLNVNNFPPMAQNASYTDKVGTAVSSVAQTFYGGNTRDIVERAKLTTKTGAENFYFNRYEELLGTSENPTKIGRAVKNMINSTDNVVETQKTKEGGYTYILPVLKKGNKTVFVPDPVAENLITNENADITQRNIKFIPQDYFNNYVLEVLESQNKNEIDKFIKIYGQ